ncbi:MAG: hypothetical protein NTX59_05850 [Elusimicrobia bacterium]|nr:hypothetical protein [Elusimicrobiota bacterium]
MASYSMRSLIVIFLLALSGPPAVAQVLLGAEVSPDAFLKKDEASLDTFSDDAFAWALSAQVSPAILYSVFESTAGEKEILKHLHAGLYRQELITLILISEKTAVPFSKLASELAKDGSLRQLAKKHGVDLTALFSEAGKMKAAADLDTPLFMESLTADNLFKTEQASTAAAVSSGAFTAEISTVADNAIGPRQASGAVADSPPKAEQASVTPAGKKP